MAKGFGVRGFSAWTANMLPYSTNPADAAAIWSALSGTATTSMDEPVHHILPSQWPRLRPRPRRRRRRLKADDGSSLLALLTEAEWPLVRGAATGVPLRLPQATVDGRWQQRVVDVRAYGAKADNSTDCTRAINKALEVAMASPGAVVVLPAPGIYLSGPLLINRARHLTLRIEAGATLASLGIDLALNSRWPIVPALYPASKPPAERERMYAPILWLLDAHNVIIEGGGMIDGRGERGWWQTAVRPAISPNSTCPDPHCIDCDGSCPKRPRLFLCHNSSFVSVRGVTFHHSPFWTTHFYNSTDIQVQALRVDNPAGGPHGHEPFVSKYGYGPNADGIDVEHSRRVLIENCAIRCGDDAICLKSGFAPSDLPPTSDVLARNNSIHTSCPHVPPANKNDGCGAMKLGYGTHAGIENVLFDHNRVEFAGLAIKISSHLGEGGALRNISWHNTHVLEAGIVINVDLGTTKSTNTSQLSSLDGLSIINLSAVDSVGCLPSVTPGFYCGGAGCLVGNRLQSLGSITLQNVSISSRDLATLPKIGWLCDNVSEVTADGVEPAVCAPAAKFGCSET